jgi:hypothetical protein
VWLCQRIEEQRVWIDGMLVPRLIIDSEKRPLVQRFHEIDHIAPNIHFVIPGRRSEAQANPESSNRRQ